MKNSKTFFKCTLRIYARNGVGCTRIELGEFDKLSKAEAIRQRLEVNNPKRIIALDVESRTDTTPFPLFVENFEDTLDQMLEPYGSDLSKVD